jgi:hypothetical protein
MAICSNDLAVTGWGSWSRAITHRNPGLVAKMAATALTTFRTVGRYSRAWSCLERGGAQGLRHRLFPPAAERLALPRSRASLIRSLFGDAVTTFDGEHCTMLRGRYSGPSPFSVECRSSSAAAGERTTLRIVAQQRRPLERLRDPRGVTQKRSVLQSHCANIGRDPDVVGVTLNCGVSFETASLQCRRGFTRSARWLAFSRLPPRRTSRTARPEQGRPTPRRVCRGRRLRDHRRHAGPLRLRDH